MPSSVKYPLGFFIVVLFFLTQQTHPVALCAFFSPWRKQGSLRLCHVNMSTGQLNAKKEDAHKIARGVTESR